jgi:L-fuculose-phosphate aldolase
VRSEFEARREIVEIGRRLWARSYVASNDGNVSARLGDRILVTPTGVSKGFLRTDDIVAVTPDGVKLSGAADATSELPMHLAVYRARPDVGAVVHAHPPKATGFAVAGVPLAQCVLPEVVLTLGHVPLAGYATPSTEEVARAVEELIARHNAILLSNHGALTLGRDLMQAYYRMETVEHFAEITLAARALGGPSPLSSEDVRKLLSVREQLGIEALADCTDCGACGSAAGAAGVAGAGGGGTEDAVGEPTASSAGAAVGADEEELVRAVLARLEQLTAGKGNGK